MSPHIGLDSWARLRKKVRTKVFLESAKWEHFKKVFSKICFWWFYPAFEILVSVIRSAVSEMWLFFSKQILSMGSPGLRTGCLYLCLALLAALILLTTITIHWVIATTNLGLVSNNGQEGQRKKNGKIINCNFRQASDPSACWKVAWRSIFKCKTIAQWHKQWN